MILSVRCLFKKTLLFLFCGLVALFLGRQIWKNLEGLRRVRVLRKNTTYLAEESNRLRGEVERRESLEFVEQEAREKLGMVKEGERVIILPEFGEEREKKEVSYSLLDLKKPPYWREWVQVFGF